ncbi:MAG: FtsX-like permease family protein, partial [Cyclobacteriaceae bacterium]|nr:FtsX-like permease family protein [Cyclobacteriaceae bacterium]
ISKTKVVVLFLVILFPILFASYQTSSILLGSLFFLGLFVAFICLFLLATLLMRIVRRFFPKKASFIFKQSLSNLFRPNNQTTVLVVVIGLGAFLIATLNIVQTSLLNQVEFVGSENESNTILFDIQPYQKEEVVKLTEENNLEVLQLVPIITCRINKINGLSVPEIQKDTSDEIPNWALTREYRVTYRDSLNHSEKLLEGKIQQIVKGPSPNKDSIFVTISEGMQENLGVAIGDSIEFNVQGVPFLTFVGGIREVDWPVDPPNFIFVFPGGVLEKAPQIYVLTTNIEGKSIADKYSREVVAKFPNISIIDLRLILRTIDEFFEKVAFVIQFMAFFSIFTGLIVLAGSVVNSKYARLKENVLLRTLGASRRQISFMTILEYGYLGLFSGIVGIGLSLVSGWTLSFFMFDIIFYPDVLGLTLIWVGVIGLTMFIGWFNTRSIMNRSPLEILRKEN